MIGESNNTLVSRVDVSESGKMIMDAFVYFEKLEKEMDEKF